MQRPRIRLQTADCVYPIMKPFGWPYDTMHRGYPVPCGFGAKTVLILMWERGALNCRSMPALYDCCCASPTELSEQQGDSGMAQCEAAETSTTRRLRSSRRADRTRSTV